MKYQWLLYSLLATCLVAATTAQLKEKMGLIGISIELGKTYYPSWNNFNPTGEYRGHNWFQGNWAWNPSYGWMPWYDVIHEPLKLTTPPPQYIDGTKVPHPTLESPDLRIPEPPFLAYRPDYYLEQNRPYRISPVGVFLAKWADARPYWSDCHLTSMTLLPGEPDQIGSWLHIQSPECAGFITMFSLTVRASERPWNMNCACVTVFKYTHVLAGCAILTPRHVLTTATSVEIVLERYRNYASLANLLMVIYEAPHKGHWNTTMRAFPARIHYHPEYLRPNKLNRSHPLPINDLAVITTTANMLGYHFGDQFVSVTCCKRAVSGKYEIAPPTFKEREQLFVVGALFIFAIHRKPMSYFKYAVRLQEPDVSNCPKKDWAWFNCVSTEWFAKYGMDSGASLFIDSQGVSQRNNGLLGINAFSMRFRSAVTKSYFTVLDTHPVLEFLYAAYNGRLPYEFLDYRFDDTQFRSPKLKEGRALYKEERWNSVVTEFFPPWQ